MKYFLGAAIGILGVGYLFLPGEKLILAVAIILTIFLIWLVEKL